MKSGHGRILNEKCSNHKFPPPAFPELHTNRGEIQRRIPRCGGLIQKSAMPCYAPVFGRRAA
jgi:hypothetical protein